MTDDRRLLWRIALTLAGVLAVDLLFVGVLAALLVPWLTPVGNALGAALGGPARSDLAVWLATLAVGLAVFLPAQLWYTRRQLLARVEAARATDASHPDLLARVRRLAATASAPVPAVAVVDSEVPNSFTVGGLGDATLVVSEGLLARLDGEQLDAVLAHELAHVRNRDAAVLTLSSFLPALVEDRPALGLGSPDERPAAWGVVLVVGFLLAAGLVEAPPFSPAHLGTFLALVLAAVLLGGVALGVLATLMVALSRWLSRSRELAADRAGARLTGDPATLATVLEQLGGTDRPDRDARADDELAALCLLPYGFDAPADTSLDGDRFTLRTRSHPPVDERVARLRALAAEME